MAKWSILPAVLIGVSIFYQPAPSYAQTIVGTWVSQEHYAGAASCHPHCRDGQGDPITWRGPVPSYPGESLRNFRIVCRDGGDGACRFDPSSLSVNPGVEYVIQLLNRSNQIWVHVEADRTRP